MDLSKLKNDKKVYFCRWYFIVVANFVASLGCMCSENTAEAQRLNNYSVSRKKGAGFFGLPLVWLVNAVWFFEEAFRKPFYEEQRQIKKYVIYSAIGAFIWAVAVSTWVCIFQSYRAEWGEFGDDISFIIPTGIK